MALKRARGHDSTGRSRYEGRHVRLFHYMLDSPAWRSLSPVERATYLELARRYNGSNNGRIGLSVRDAAAALGVSKTTISRALQTLTERGFIEVARKGHFDRKSQHASEYRLLDIACDVTREVARRTFMRWRTTAKAGPHSGTDGPSGGE